MQSGRVKSEPEPINKRNGLLIVSEVWREQRMVYKALIESVQIALQDTTA